MSVPNFGLVSPNVLHLTVVLDKYHWILYFLVTAMYPRFLITLNEELKSFPVTVRVGQVCSVPFLRRTPVDPERL